MASLEEVWGSPFPKKTKVSDKSGVPVRDAEIEGRVFSHPSRRTANALDRHKKTIDDLHTTLPIAQTEEDLLSNYKSVPPTQTKNNIEHFTQREHYETQYAPIYGGQPKSHVQQKQEYAYAPVHEQGSIEQKIDRMMRMIDQNKTGYETPSTNDTLLYIFTGLFFLFTLDTFVQIGRRMN